MEEKKKRGCNYTATEKNILLQLIKKHQNIIENKETNATMIQKKREAWDSVCQQYNHVAASGHRTWQQLRHLYENLKQRSKKNIAKLHKEINRNGLGIYKTSLSEQDTQVLAMVAPQVLPLSNTYDDATMYFGDTEGNYKIKTEVEIEASPELEIMNNNIHDDQDTVISNELQTTVKMERTEDEPSTIIPNTADDQNAVAPVHQKCNKPSTSNSDLTGRVKHKRREINVKQEYFKAKLRNAQLENKYLINKNKMEINKYKIEMQILKLRLKKMNSSIKHYRC